MGREFIIFGLIFSLVILFTGFTSAASCSITTSCAAENTVFKLSSAANAHAELYNQDNYGYYLCCDFTGTHECLPQAANTILKLSDVTNAHAQTKSFTGYTELVCFEDLSCTSTTSSSCSESYPIEMVSLSAETNAHVGEFNNYETKICCAQEALPPDCSLTSASWSQTSTTEGSLMYLNVNAQNCENLEIAFEIQEDDSIFDDSVNVNPSNAYITGGVAQATWTAEWQAESWPESDPPEYYFTATIIGGTYAGEYITSNNQLQVYQYVPPGGGGVCDNIVVCSDYTSGTYCNNDDGWCNVAENSAPSEINCGEVNCDCLWNTETSQCNFVYSETLIEGDCGDEVINIGEQCDGNEWGPIIGCDNFGLTDGILSCGTDCKFNTTQCVGTTGVCGDALINPGETCDGIDWGNINSCTNFNDFFGGTLLCDSSCQFDTNQCVKEGESSLGRCVYEETTTDTCEDDGYLSFSWTAIWIWDEGNPAHYDPDGLSLQCVDGSKTVECPAQIPLPFFNTYNLIITVVIIALIYWVWNAKKKPLKKQKIKGKKK